jgi:hypothetical protein
MKEAIYAFLCVFAIIGGAVALNGSGEGIHIVSPNAVLLEGEVVTINWSGNVSDFDNAKAKWLELTSK